MTGEPAHALCDRHVGEAYPPRCRDCESLALESTPRPGLAFDTRTSRAEVGQLNGYPVDTPPAGMTEPQRSAYWRHRARTIEDSRRDLEVGIRAAVQHIADGRPTFALRVLTALTTPKEVK